MNPFRFLLKKIFVRVGSSKRHQLKVVYADGSEYTNYESGEPELTIHFKTPQAETRSLYFFFEGFFEKYIDEEIDLVGENPVTTLAELGHAVSLDLSLHQENAKLHHVHGYVYSPNPITVARKWFQEWYQNNWSYAVAKKNAEFHYAIHPALFEHFLGDTVGYSEGYWTKETKNLNQAKHNIYEYICRKLRLQPGDRVMEVGAGWGFLPIYMVKNYDVLVVMYNPVKRQNDYMIERFKQHGVADRIRVVEGEHHDIFKEPEGSFDKFVTVGVHEHHGMDMRMYHRWWESIAYILKKGGTGFISCTSYNKRVATNFLTLKYIFPGGNLPSLPHELIMMHEHGIMLLEVENLWPHYQRTVREWRDRFNELWPEIQKADPVFFTERFRRLWSMYLEGTTETFDNMLDLSHMLFTNGRSNTYYPWTREGRHQGDFREGDDAVECYPLVKNEENRYVFEPSPAPRPPSAH